MIAAIGFITFTILAALQSAAGHAKKDLNVYTLILSMILFACSVVTFEADYWITGLLFLLSTYFAVCVHLDFESGILAPPASLKWLQAGLIGSFWLGHIFFGFPILTMLAALAPAFVIYKGIMNISSNKGFLWTPPDFKINTIWQLVIVVLAVAFIVASDLLFNKTDFLTII